MTTKDSRDLLAILKDELAFIEKGGYRNVSEHAWRPLFVLQDSLTCLNHDATKPPRPCGDCVLIGLVPDNRRNNKVPCRHIPLNELGETIDSFYRVGTRDELESALRRWLRSTIQRLEHEKALRLQQSCPAEIHVCAKGTAILGLELDEATPQEDSCSAEIHVRAKAARVV